MSRSGSDSTQSPAPDVFADAPDDAEVYERALEAAATAAEDAAAFGSDGCATSAMLERRLGTGVPAAPRLSLRHAAAANAALAGPGSPAFRDAPPELRSLPTQPSTLDAGAPGSAARLTQAEALVWSAAQAIAAQQRHTEDDAPAEAEQGVPAALSHFDAAAAHRAAPASAQRTGGVTRAPARDAYAQGFEQGRLEAAAAVAARSFAAGLKPLAQATPNAPWAR